MVEQAAGGRNNEAHRQRALWPRRRGAGAQHRGPRRPTALCFRPAQVQGLQGCKASVIVIGCRRKRKHKKTKAWWTSAYVSPQRCLRRPLQPPERPGFRSSSPSARGLPSRRRKSSRCRGGGHDVTASSFTRHNREGAGRITGRTRQCEGRASPRAPLRQPPSTARGL